MYRIGLDIGIGSVGWAVVANNGSQPYIEDFGVRIFESGEEKNGKDTFCQARRGFRGVRRLTRRRFHRKLLLRNLFEVSGLTSPTFNDDLEYLRDTDVYDLKVKGLTQKLSFAELYKCLLHTCNHRGYRDFYDSDTSEDAATEEGKNKAAVHDFETRYRASHAPSVSAYLVAQKNGNFVNFRNRSGSSSDFLLINRKFLQDEVEQILNCQQKYYPAITEQVKSNLIKIVFAQRTFEDGPGQHGTKDYKYGGFLEALGQCSFYSDQKRGFKCTVLSDIYGVINTLSQYKYINRATGEFDLPKDTAKEIVAYILENANLTPTDLKKILGKYGIAVIIPKDAKKDALQKSIHFLRSVKQAIEEAGENWHDYIDEEQFDLSRPSLLHQIGETLSQYQTPKYRKDHLKALLKDHPALLNSLSCRKFSGTSRVSYKYMVDAIEAFCNGEIYGNFQARILQSADAVSAIEKAVKLSAKCIDDEDVRKNRVVFKSINETRKIVNAIIDVYGSPNEIVIEVADELGMGYDARMAEMKRQNTLEKENDAVKAAVAAILGVAPDHASVSGMAIDKYRLYEQQHGKCPYCGKPLGEETYIVKENKGYEVDHIVPYSLILDNTLNNKVLVHTECNQRKGQRTPLEYLAKFSEEKSAYLDFVKEQYSRTERPISKKKYEYLLCPSVAEAAENGTLDAWKSRNLNDTRYITKYVVSMFKKYLQFAESEYKGSEHVIAVKGAVTSRFRRIWLRDADKWGAEEKDRETYLNHACDAVILANLTRPYIEIGSAAIRLRQLWKKYQSRSSAEYENFKDDCIRRMSEIYGFNENYTVDLLRYPDRVPSYVPDLRGEILARFVEDEALLDESVAKFYGGKILFIRQPHVPIASIKQAKKYNGEIADSNYIRVETIDGKPHKIKRDSVLSIKKSDIAKIYGADADLLASLHAALDGHDEKYTIENYLRDHQLTAFKTQKGQPVRMVSTDGGVISNYYPVDKGEGGVNLLGGTKYYTVELYRNEKDELGVYGIRFVDLVKKGGKLYQKPESRPDDYVTHIMYLFPNDYIVVKDSAGKEKYSGYYKAVYNINQGMLCVATNPNRKDTKSKGFARKDSVQKQVIDLLGSKGGIVKCSEPFPLLPEKK